MSEIMVSIICAAYNHEKFIRSALDGFINQKTDFNFEVLVHDDASTDNTANIIREYEKAYPNIIKPIYQSENKFSKSVDIQKEIIIPIARGKYIALCEGDDYWIDEHKLQKQVDYLESHPDCTICFTNAYTEDQQRDKKREIFLPGDDNEVKTFPAHYKDYTLNNAYEIKFAPTASYIYPRDIYIKVSQNFVKCQNGDLQVRLMLTASGYAHFINEATCVYRINVPNSCETVWKKQSKSDGKNRCQLALNMLEKLDQMTEGKYSEGIWQFKRVQLISYIAYCTSLKVLKNPYLGRAFREIPLKEKIKIVLRVYLPNSVYVALQGLRRRLQ